MKIFNKYDHVLLKLKGEEFYLIRKSLEDSEKAIEKNLTSQLTEHDHSLLTTILDAMSEFKPPPE